MSALAPIVVFAFNRPDLLEKSLKQLVQCELAEISEIYFFIDGARNSRDFKPINDCCTLAQEYSSYFSKSNIIKRDINLGLATSLKDGISKVLTKNDSVIVLEDDLVVGKSFLKFMNAQLCFYKSNLKVGSISGFSTKVNEIETSNYFHPRPCSWGWATWEDRWSKAIWELSEVDVAALKCAKKQFNEGGEDLYRMLLNQLNGKINSWAIFWSYSHFKNGWLASYPAKSKVLNLGFGTAATHCKGINPFPCEFFDVNTENMQFAKDIKVNINIKSRVNKYHSNLYKLYIKLIGKIKR